MIRMQIKPNFTKTQWIIIISIIIIAMTVLGYLYDIYTTPMPQDLYGAPVHHPETE